MEELNKREYFSVLTMAAYLSGNLDYSGVVKLANMFAYKGTIKSDEHTDSLLNHLESTQGNCKLQTLKWIKCSDKLPSGVSGNYMAFRPKAPVESRVSTLWFDPLYQRWSGKYAVTHWARVPNEPNI
jgi:hypothetical protein